MQRARGFTLIEILVAVAILAVLGALAVVGYGQYTTRAGAADLISRHHDIRTAVIANAATRSTDNCTDLVKAYDGSKLADPFATLSYGFEKVGNDGYRPVLAVCATAAQSGGVAVARRAHETFAREGVVEKNPVLTDTVVSFALRLTPADQALCKNAPSASTPTCGGAAPAVPQQATAQPAAAKAPAPVAPQPFNPATAVVPPTVKAVAASATSCPAGQELVVVSSAGGTQRACAPKCQAGERRGPSGQCVADQPPPQPAWVAQAQPPVPVTAPPPATAGEPTSCPAGQQLIATFLGGKLQQVCTKACPAGQSINGAGQCVADSRPEAMCPGAPVQDTYLGDCSVDFNGLCYVSHVKEVCAKTCGATSPEVPCSSLKFVAGSTPQAPTTPGGFRPFFSSVLPPNIGESVYFDNDEFVTMLGVRSPDGVTPVQVTSVVFKSENGLGARAERQADGRWRITRTEGDPRNPNGNTATITVDNGFGTHVIESSWSAHANP